MKAVQIAAPQKMQILGCIIGMVAMVIVSLMDYSFILRFTWLYYIGIIVLLGLVMTGIGDSAGGAQRWIDFGGFLSGMALANSGLTLLLVHPFVIILKPAVAMSAQPDSTVALVALVETLLFLAVGLWLAKYRRYE